MGNKYFSYTRFSPAWAEDNLTGGENNKWLADAFLLQQDEPFTAEQLKYLLDHPLAKKYCNSPEEAYVQSYYKASTNKYRAVLTRVCLYTEPLTDEHVRHQVAFYKDGEFRFYDYDNVFDNCAELYRADGCQECPKIGKRCVLQHFNLADPMALLEIDDLKDEARDEALKKFSSWPFVFPHNRVLDATSGMNLEGFVTERDDYLEEKEFVTPPGVNKLDFYNVLAADAKATPFEGFIFKGHLETFTQDQAQLDEELVESMYIRQPKFTHFYDGPSLKPKPYVPR